MTKYVCVCVARERQCNLPFLTIKLPRNDSVSGGTVPQMTLFRHYGTMISLGGDLNGYLCLVENE